MYDCRIVYATFAEVLPKRTNEAIGRVYLRCRLDDLRCPSASARFPMAETIIGLISQLRHNGDKIEIVDGHLRVKAARKRKLPAISVIFRDDWSEARVKGFRLLVNLSATWATRADELVALELADLDALDFDLSLTGFDLFEIDELLFPDSVEASAEQVPDVPKIAVTRLGDL